MRIYQLKNQSGISMVEILTTIGIVGIITMGSLRVWSISEGATAQAKSRSELATLADEIRSGLAHRDTCTRNLEGTRLTVSDPNPTRLTSIKYFDTDGHATRDLIAEDPRNRAAQFAQVIPRAQISATEILSDLEVISRKPDGTVLSKRKVPIIAQMDGNRIESCVAGADDTADMKEKVCVLTGDEYSYWDPADQRCKSKKKFKYQRVYGTPASAACVAPWEPTGECWADEPRGFQDDTPRETRTYPDGSTETVGGPPYLCLMTDAMTCGCFYATGVSSVGFRSWLTCQQVEISR